VLHVSGNRAVGRYNHWILFMGVKDGQAHIVDPPLRAGDFVGHYELRVDGKEVKRSKLYVAKRLDKPSRKRQAAEYAKLWKQAWKSGVHETRHGAGKQWHRFEEYWGLA
jgi:hypothetical protein